MGGSERWEPDPRIYPHRRGVKGVIKCDRIARPTTTVKDVSVEKGVVTRRLFCFHPLAEGWSKVLEQRGRHLQDSCRRENHKQKGPVFPDILHCIGTFLP